MIERTKHGVMVEDKHGEPCEFVFNCGAARLEVTEWTKDFPEPEKSMDDTMKSTDDAGC